MFAVVRNFFYMLIFMFLLGIIVAVVYAFKLDKEYNLSDEDLGGALWAMPAKVYARGLELYAGADLRIEELIAELKLLEYKESDSVIDVYQYQQQGNIVIYYAPEFAFWDGLRAPRRMAITFAEDGTIQNVQNLSTLENVVIERLEPLHIASIYPTHNQDRILVDYEDVPEILIDGLIAVEDRRFWQHPGIDPKGLLRSIYVTFITKSDVQGASTLTQQFIKNHYLTNEKRISRKIKEMLMAIMLEYHSDKKDILEGYLNEIYLGQDGSRAIHGFGLASEFYFGKDLKELFLHEVALLIALVREPGQADPRRHPEYAIERRNLILKVFQERGLISDADRKLAASLPLDVKNGENSSQRIRYPAFVDLVFAQLRVHYNQEDLTSEGLNIFTTLDPQIQQNSQRAIAAGLGVLEKKHALEHNFLQAATVIANTQNGEILAIVGARDGEVHGFNRAISAKRQIGSLIKPAVYLAALEYTQRYNLATPLDDSPLIYQRGGEKWSPKNYSRRNHGNVLLIDALVKSYNIPTARIALDLGISDIIMTLRRLGTRENLPHYPSLSLGAVEMSPLEVAQFYETFASGGYYTPLRSIREITTKDGKIVDRFAMSGVQAIDPRTYFLIVSAMQQIPKRGTAASMKAEISPDLHIAGKTGTTDNYRDSWFAGFSGNLLNVTWVGNDNNKSTGLSGSKGGLRIWIDIMKQLNLKALNPKMPDGIEMRAIDRSSGALAGRGCSSSFELPFIIGTAPRHYASCQPRYDRVNENDYFYNSNEPLYPATPKPTNPAGNTQGWFTN